MLRGAVRLVDPVLDGGFARAAAAVELVGCGPCVVQEEQAKKRPRKRDEEEEGVFDNYKVFVLVCVMERHGQKSDDRSQE